MRAAISAALVAWPLASVGLAAQDPVPPPAADTILPPVTDTIPPPVTDTLAPPATNTLAPPVAESPPPNPGVAVDSVEVRGNGRIAANTIRGTAGLAAGATITAVDVQRAIRRLMSSGDFANVRVYSRDPTGAGTTLVVEVVERPLIASTNFPGLESVGAGTVRDTVGWEPRQPLDPQRVVRTEQMIRDLLAKRGVQLVSLDTALTLVPGDSQAYRLAFNVREGNRLAIANIDFEGNSA
ncbi:MAG: POTRA domain-containing protein, partial [Longimicrobiaceae bacterium]